jgi:hypothetical protein
VTTTSLAHIPNISEPLSQGDIFENITYSFVNNNIDKHQKSEEIINFIEFQFPYAIILSQGCDVKFMSEIVASKKGKSSKYMPSILLCPIYKEQAVLKNNHLKYIPEIDIQLSEEPYYSKRDADFSSSDMHYRYHRLTIKVDKQLAGTDLLIDFKHCFSLHAGYLLNNLTHRKFTLETIFAEQITLKFASYLSRIAIPDLDY